MRANEYLSYFVNHVIIRTFFIIIALGGTGLALIAYELLADRLQLRGDVSLANWLTFLGPLLTFAGVAVTAASIFVPATRVSAPDPSNYIVAPIVILACCFAAYWLYVTGSVADNIVNGFALIGLSGALMRIQPHPQKPVSDRS